ncbi:hypothetical protein [uncultured Bacteroides sp.]|uniref:hypothetical protein n=1 Tax=uncultured Bacteroides sp. TaxID=162156 RepID=UPI00280A899C|nr:hypothetical protein [uncultured Bacteroides sp.]
MKPQEKQGCLIGIGLLILWFVLFFLSIEFDSPILKGLSFGIPGFVISFIYGKYFGVKEFQWKNQKRLTTHLARPHIVGILYVDGLWQIMVNEYLSNHSTV